MSEEKLNSPIRPLGTFPRRGKASLSQPLKIFIAGTDTNIGKTYVSAGLLTAFNRLGYSTLGIKPIASGCQRINQQLCNEDSLIHMQHASIKLSHDQITPFAFEPPIAPHIAALESGCELSVATLNKQTHEALHYPADISIIEGCGGWYVPLNANETMADFVIANEFSVILVVGMRLGCINHSLLTYRAMERDGVKIKGWIANCIDPAMKNLDENIETLKAWLPTSCLGVIPYGSRPEDVIDASLL
jgi:dethiobiotin synthetase